MARKKAAKKMVLDDKNGLGYVVLDDEKVVHVWRCGKCGNKAEVNPTFYAESGTPICTGEKECEGDDMEYVETRLLD